jgi:hypothetical protein
MQLFAAHTVNVRTAGPRSSGTLDLGRREMGLVVILYVAHALEIAVRSILLRIDSTASEVFYNVCAMYEFLSCPEGPNRGQRAHDE